MTATFQLPYADSYWVAPGQLMAGEYPGGYDELVTRKRIISLLRCGVTAFVDLTKPGDSSQPYEGILAEEAGLYGVMVDYDNYPIVDFGTPPAAQMRAILKTINQHINMGKVVYVHCLAGIGRTGMVVGCYLVEQGLSGQGALTRIQDLRQNTPSWWHRSPENDEQVNFILDWNAPG